MSQENSGALAAGQTGNNLTPREAVNTLAGASSPGAATFGAWADLKAPKWKAFAFAGQNGRDQNYYLLHVPSSHVLEVPEATYQLVLDGRKEALDAEAGAELEQLALSLPMPKAPTVTTDIRTISLNMAQGCNLRCTYCFAGEGDYGTKAMMSFATAKRTIEFFATGKPNFHVLFFGGEPMLNFTVIEETVAWAEIWAKAASCHLTFSMTTNGTLLTPEKLAWLKAKGFALNLSYDGKGLQARQRLNKDKLTNSEALVERKLEAFKDQLSQMRDFRIRATVMKENMGLLEEAIVGTLTSRNFKLFVSHHATPLRAMSFGEADVAELGNILRRVVDRFLATKDYQTLLRIENLKNSVRQIHHGKTHGKACGAGVNYLTVSATGSFYLCHRFNEDETENFGDLEVGLRQDRLDEIASFRGAKQEPCNSCWMRQWCAGGCFHEHKAANGNKFAIDPLYCKLQALELEQAMRVYTVLLSEAPELLEA